MTTINAVGQQYAYGAPSGIVEADISITPDGQQYAWLVGTATVTVVSNINVTINASSQGYQWQLGIPTLNLTTVVNAIGQQYAYQFGQIIVQTSTSASVFAVGQQYNWAGSSPSIQITQGNPIVIVPPPTGETFIIEGCPQMDTNAQLESACGQSTTTQAYRYDGTLIYNGLHTYGAS